jgi:dTMP kinase
VVLDVEPQTGRRRRGDEHDRLESEPDDFHSRVRDRFLELARRAPSRYLLLDGNGDAEEIAGQVRARLVALLPESPVARDARLAREEQQRAEAAAREQEQQQERARAEQRRREEDDRLERERAGRAARDAAELEARERAQREAAERAAGERAARERAAAERAAPTPGIDQRPAAGPVGAAGWGVGAGETAPVPAVSPATPEADRTMVLPTVDAAAPVPASGERKESSPEHSDARPHRVPTDEPPAARDDQTQPLPVAKPGLDDEIFGSPGEGRR